MRGAKENPFLKSLGNITWVAAIIVTFFVFPTVYIASRDVILAFARVYSSGEGFLGFVGLAWMFLCAVLVYSITRAALSAALAAIGLYLVLYFSKDGE